MNAIVIEQSADDARLAFEVHRNVDIHRLRLSRSRLDAPIPHAPADEESSRSISVSFTYGSKALQAPPGALRLEVRFRMTGTVESKDLIAAGDAPPQAKKSDRAIFVECVWEVDYLLKGEFRISDEQTKAFKDGNAIFNAWPYFREYLQSSMERMGLPPLAAPFLRLEPRLPRKGKASPAPAIHPD